MASATAASVPGMTGTHSSALWAGMPIQGSSTTCFMPRARASAILRTVVLTP